ncbi:MAG: hypothetical protein ACRD6X_01325 [Pyrinomonadaceae bacterium]
MLIPIVLLVIVGAYIYSLWAAEKQKTAAVPVEAASMMMRDLLAFHEKRGGFPGDLKQLEGVVWEKRPDRNFAIENRALSHRNYFYLYTRLTAHRFSLWAIPTGQARDDGATWFLLVTPDSCRRWKGAALPLASIKELVAAPSNAELGVLGLTEQPGIDLVRSRPLGRCDLCWRNF